MEEVIGESHRNVGASSFSSLQQTGNTAAFWLTRLTCAGTLLLIVLGALVTSFGVGMAVPDWPTTFGQNMFTFPWFGSNFDVFLEHGHRLLGSLVGLLTLSLAIWVWASDRRRWMRGLVLTALAAVVVQGILGGLRVIQIDSRWAIVHGALAQAFFALSVALVFFFRKEGKAQTKVAVLPQRLLITTVALIYLQIVSGSILRHSGALLWLHLLLAIGVLVHVFLLVVKSISIAPMRNIATVCAALAGLQWILGFGSWLTMSHDEAGLTVRGDMPHVAFTVAHVMTGALLLGFSLWLLLKNRENARVS